jgi:hypothetical protein
MTEYGREARITFDCAEYLGFDQTEAAADATLEPSERGAEGLRIQVGTPVRLEVYAHPEAFVRVYVRPHAPTQTVLRLLGKIGAAIEREQNLWNEITRAPNEERPVSERPGSEVNEDRQERLHEACCHRCKLSLDKKSFIQGALGRLCIGCARELDLLVEPSRSD